MNKDMAQIPNKKIFEYKEKDFDEFLRNSL